MILRKLVLKDFNPGDYAGIIQLAGNHEVYLKGIAVTRSLPPAEMALSKKVAVVVLDERNAREAVAVSVCT